MQLNTIQGEALDTNTTFKSKNLLKCNLCNKDFEVKYLNSNRKFCSKKCSFINCQKLAIKKTTKYSGKHKIHFKWMFSNMKRRCYNPKDSHFKSYGGRGIKICDKWLNNRTSFYLWAESKYQDGFQIERINNDGDYCPENCTFIPKKDQQKNTQKTIYLIYKGEKKRVQELVEITGISYIAFQHRIERGWTLDKMFKPMRKRGLK